MPGDENNLRALGEERERRRREAEQREAEERKQQENANGNMEEMEGLLGGLFNVRDEP